MLLFCAILMATSGASQYKPARWIRASKPQYWNLARTFSSGDFNNDAG